MLRNPPSRIPLNMADVNQLKRRPKLKQASHPLVAQTDWAYVHPRDQTSRRHPPSPTIIIREGAQRFRDEHVVVVQPDSNRHVPQSAILENVQDSDSSDTDSTSFELEARLVQIAEVSPTITQVSSYDPPALLGISPEQSPIRNRRRVHPSLDRQTQHQDTSRAAIENRSIQPDYHPLPPASPREPLPRRFDQSLLRDNHFHTGTLSRAALLDPHAPAFIPRVRLGSAFQRTYDHHASDLGSGHLRIRSASSRNSDNRGQPIPHPGTMPRSRIPAMHGHQGGRGPRRPGTASHVRTGYTRFPSTNSAVNVMDRYPVFPSASSHAEAPSFDRTIQPSHEDIQERYASSTRRTNHMLYPQPRFAQVSDSNPSLRSRASTSSLSVPNLVSPFGGPLIHSRESSLYWSDRRTSRPGSPRSFRSRSGASSLSLSRCGAASDRHGESGFSWHSPLDQLTQELDRLASNSFRRSHASLECTSRVTSTDGRLLSGSVFYSDSDEDTGPDSVSLTNLPGPSSSKIGPTNNQADECAAQACGVSKQNFNASIRNIHMGPRDTNVETGLQSVNMGPLRLSPSTRSNSSTSSIMSSSPPAYLPRRTPITPGPRTPFAPNRENRPRVTPRVRVYDDNQAAGMQPRTPADLLHRREAVEPISLASAPHWTEQPSVGMTPAEQSPPISAPYSHRNTYPSLPQPHSGERDRNREDSSPYSPDLDLRNAAAASAVERRRITRMMPVEHGNAMYLGVDEMEAERHV